MRKKYGRFTTINILKYEHFTRKINKTYSHPVCPLQFLVISAVLSLLYLHCHSCQKTKSRLHTPVSTVVHAEVVCAPKILPIGIFLSHTLRSFLGPRFTCLTLSTQRSVIIAPELIFENEVNDSLFYFISHTVALHVLSKGKAPLSIFII